MARIKTYLVLLTVVVVIGQGCNDERPEIPAMEDLICYFPCEVAEDGGALDIVDSGVDAKYKGKKPPLIEGPFGNALRNHGAGQRDLIRSGLNLGTNDFTIAFWVNPKGYSWHNFEGNGGKGCIVYGYKPELFIFLNDSGNMNLTMPDADGAMMSAKGMVKKNQWTHMAFIVDRNDNDGCKIYMNGVAVPLSFANMEKSKNHAYNMEEGFMVGRSIVGDLDEIAVYRKALSADEVATMCRRVPDFNPEEKPIIPKLATNYSPRRKPYKIIYEVDTSLALANSLDLDDYIQGVAGFLDSTHVDAVFWHDGAGGNTANYDSDVLELTGERVDKIHLFLKKLIADGNDPPAIAVREIKKRGADIFFTCRLNDCHDSIRNGKRRPDLVATFKLENPEWTFGTGQLYGGIYQLNFAISEVRDFKFAVIEEVFRKYDFDGLEIDFLRNAPYFLPGTEPENSHILTQFLRRVREHLNKRGKERGRDVALAVRVTEGLEAARLDGFDVPVWIEEDLIDIIILGSNAIDMEIEKFKELTRGKEILVYPCLYFGRPNWLYGLNAEMVHALATNYHFQGADGIYVFNWFAHNYIHRPKRASMFAEQLDWLREIDDPEAMRGRDKRYVADRGTPSWAYPHGRIHCVLPAKLGTGNEATLTVLVGEDLSQSPFPKDIEINLELNELADSDTFEVILNKHRLSDFEHIETGIRKTLIPEQLITGYNKVEIYALEGEFVVNGLEINISY